MNRKSVDYYAVLWLAGAGFLWWPFVLVRVLADRRSPGRRPVALLLTTGALVTSLLVAAALQAPVLRILGASANLTVWFTLCLLMGRPWSRSDVDGVVRGIVDLAAVQGVLVVVARSIYPTLATAQLPLAHLLPASLATDPNVSSFSTLRLAVLDYYGKPVIRTAGIFGNPTWGGAFAAIAIVLLVFSSDSLGPRMARPSVRIALIALSSYTLYFSYARVDVVGLLVAIAVISAIKVKRVVDPAMWVVLVYLVAGLAIVMVLVLPLQSWFAELNSQRAGSLVAREDIYGPTLKEVMKLPNLLVGAGIKARVDGLVASLGTHSTYLGLAYRGGLVAAVGFVFFLGGLAARGVNSGADVAVGLACFLLLFCLTDDFDAGHLVPLAAIVAFGFVSAGRSQNSEATDRSTHTLGTH